MRAITRGAIAEIIVDLDNELHRLERLKNQMRSVQTEITQSPHLREMLAESLALKLHNFYTVCFRSRISIIISWVKSGYLFVSIVSIKLSRRSNSASVSAVFNRVWPSCILRCFSVVNNCNSIRLGLKSGLSFRSLKYSRVTRCSSKSG